NRLRNTGKPPSQPRPAPPRPRLGPSPIGSERILKFPAGPARAPRKINARFNFRIFSGGFAPRGAHCPLGWQSTRTSACMRNSLLVSALVLAVGAASTVPLRADGIMLTSNSSAGAASSDGSWIGPNLYGSSAVASSSDQARSFVNLSTGEMGAYVAGLDGGASTFTDATDSWIGVGQCLTNCDAFNFGVNLDINATLNPAAPNAYKELDYTFADSINLLNFSLITDGLNDFEIEATWNGTDVSSDAQQSFDSNGNWNPELTVRAKVQPNGAPEFIDSSHSMHYSVFSSQPMSSAGGDTSVLETPSTVPEPPSATLFLLGAALWFALRRRRLAL